MTPLARIRPRVVVLSDSVEARDDWRYDIVTQRKIRAEAFDRAQRIRRIKAWAVAAMFAAAAGAWLWLVVTT